jgi:exonuclease SbcC
MIITSVKAENLLKYSSLELNDLPEQGLIAISGQNESGKSTIGETICFALFGRTFSLGPDELEKAIRWGGTDCRVTLGFRTADGNHYELHRSLDREGNHGVRLNLAGQEEPMASGMRQVADAVNRVLGYGFDEFIESFYLAQREITTPHPHSKAVKKMAGLTDLEAAAGEISGEIELQLGMMESSAEGMARAQQTLDELNIRDDRLPQLEQERAEVMEHEEGMRRHMEELRNAADNYRTWVPLLPELEKKKKNGGQIALLLLLTSTAFTLLWSLFDAIPADLLYLAVVMGLAALPFLGFMLFSSQRINQLRLGAGDLGEQIRAAHHFGQGADGGGREAGEGAEVELSGLVEENRCVGLEENEVTDLCLRIADLEADAEEVDTALGRELDWMGSGLEYCRERQEQLQRDLDEEQVRLLEAQGLREQMQGLERHLAEHRQQVDLRERALELLLGATRHLSHRFNRDLQELVGKTLPLFTEGRYEHLQIEEDLTVRAFSSEKRDFINLEEISSGTQRQIMLAVRLALSQELVNRTATGNQFIFLDEPFAFFDQERTRSALDVLPRLSDQIVQVWIAAQQFPKEQPFALAVGCSREQQSLAL